MPSLVESLALLADATRLPHAEDLLQLDDGQLLLAEQEQQPQARGIREQCEAFDK